MIKNKQRSNKMSTKMTKNTKPATRSIDAQGAAYARLLMDPCNAKITHPNYAGGSAGYLIRSEKTISLAPTAHTDGLIRWAPGTMGANGQDCIFMTASTPQSQVGVAPVTNPPGKEFLGASASSYRCVAACMKLIYPGAELNRSGMVYAGNVTAQVVSLGDTVSIEEVVPLLPSYTRMPDTEIEIKWRPGFADQGFIDPNHSLPIDDLAAHSAMALAFSGGHVGTGVTIRMTAVYEWLPSFGKGLAVPASARSTSAYTLDDVLNWVKKNGGDWVRLGSAMKTAFSGPTVGRIEL